MVHKYVNFENGKIVETNDVNDIYLEWDGNYFNCYGEGNLKYQHNGKVYDCFPIVYITEDLSKVEDIRLFGCEGDNQFNDGYLDIPFKVEDWKDIEPFYNLKKHN